MSLNHTIVETEAPAGRSIARSSVVTLSLLCVSHFFIDLYSTAIGALQPLLVGQFSLTLKQVGVIGGVLAFSSSVMQPLYGYLADRFHTRIFVALSPAIAGVFISSLGLATGYTVILVMVFWSGCGVAAFHPQATATAGRTWERHRGRAMAIFITSGTLGLSLGPYCFARIAERWGLPQTAWAAVPGILVSALLLVYLPSASEERSKQATFSWSPLLAVWKPLALLYGLVFIRSVIQISFTQFLPLYLHLERGQSVSAGSGALSLFLAAGAIGGFVGGHLSDRFGGKRVILVSMIGSSPFLLAFFLTDGFVSLVCLFLGGLVLLVTNPVNVVMAQQLVPEQAGTVSAIMMGFAWGMAGLLFIPLAGWVGDLTSLGQALTALLVFPVIGFFLALRLR